MRKIDDYVNFMVKIANDDSHGYDQIHRWGEYGDYDCSSLTITALEHAGFPVKKSHGATYTGNMKQALVKVGFTDVKKSINLYTGQGLKRGDILLNEAHHVAVYVGDGLIVQASINEKGTATYGKPGDQTGKEILVKPYYLYYKGWGCVMRYVEPVKKEGGDKMVDEKKKKDINKVAAWAKPAWEKATSLGFVDGTRPGDVVTRQELAAVICRLLKEMGK